MSQNTHKTPSADASSLGRDMTSEVYELITGDDVRFFVHKDVLISQSKAFERATAVPWLEAVERKILLSDWDTDTVARLVEFLYRDDYPYPDPTPLKPVPEVTITKPGESNVVEGQLSSGEPSTPVGAAVQNRLPPNRHEKVADGQRLEPFDPALFDFERVLLAHAKVYVLAQYKGVDSLRELALKRVSLVLLRLQPLQASSHIARNVAEFAGYVYANTEDQLLRREPLREMISNFLAVNVVAFQKAARAVQLMAQGGDFVTDLMSKVCRLVDINNTSSISVTQKKRYISNIKVVLGGRWSEHMSMVKGVRGDGNLNPGGNYMQYRWLVAEYTDIAEDACTRFRSTMDVECNEEDDTLDRTLTLEAVMDEKACHKVTEAVLINGRSPRGMDMEVIKRYDGMSDNISYNSNIAVYLLWKTARTRFA